MSIEIPCQLCKHYFETEQDGKKVHGCKMYGILSPKLPSIIVKSYNKKDCDEFESKQIQCQKCEYFYITWQNGRAYGCKAYGFKSQQLPSLVVKRSSKMDCTFFTKKANTK